MKSKYYICLLILLACFASGKAQLKSNKDLIGKWSAASLKLEFMPDGRVLFVTRGGTIPGARYKTDFMQTPPLLKIELLQQAKKIVYTSAIEFLNDNSIRLTTHDKDAASAFEKQRSVVLMKEK